MRGEGNFFRNEIITCTLGAEHCTISHKLYRQHAVYRECPKATFCQGNLEVKDNSLSTVLIHETTSF